MAAVDVKLPPVKRMVPVPAAPPSLYLAWSKAPTYSKSLVVFEKPLANSRVPLEAISQPLVPVAAPFRTWMPAPSLLMEPPPVMSPE